MAAASAVRTGNTYYPTTVQGTVAAILFHSQYDNERVVRALVETASSQFKEKTGAEPTGQETFCSMVIEKNRTGTLTVGDMIKSEFFQSMQALEPSPHHDKVKNSIAPRMIAAARDHFKDAVIQPGEESALLLWCTKFAERVFSVEQVTAYAEPEGEGAEALMAERGAIGKDLYAAAQEGRLDREGLRAITAICRASLGQTIALDAKYASAAMQLAGKYLTLIGKAEHSRELAEDICTQLLANMDQIFPGSTSK